MSNAANNDAFLRIENVVKDFGGYKAVNNVSLDIAKGEIFALLGSSGCGKTTLLRMLAGFESPTSGRIVLNGQDLSGLPPYERPLNMMFQSYALFPHLTRVGQHRLWTAAATVFPRSQVADRVDAMLKLVQLVQVRPAQAAPVVRRPAAARGAWPAAWPSNRRCCCWTSRWVRWTRKLREQTQIELVNIIEQVGVTCVMVTHDQEEAMTMASRIAIMSEGRFLQVGTPSDIYETPQTRFVADFIGNVNLMEGSVDGGRGGPCRHRLRRLPALRGPRHHRHPGHARHGGIAAREDPRVSAPEAGGRRSTPPTAPSKSCPTSAASPSTASSWPAAWCSR